MDLPKEVINLCLGKLPPLLQRSLNRKQKEHAQEGYFLLLEEKFWALRDDKKLCECFFAAHPKGNYIGYSYCGDQPNKILMQVGEKVWSLSQLFMQRGFDDDTLVSFEHNIYKELRFYCRLSGYACIEHSLLAAHTFLLFCGFPKDFIQHQLYSTIHEMAALPFSECYFFLRMNYQALRPREVCYSLKWSENELAVCQTEDIEIGFPVPTIEDGDEDAFWQLMLPYLRTETEAMRMELEAYVANI